MAPDASYQVYGWDEPVVGHAAIRAELRKQAPLFSDTQTEIHAMASAGRTVFMQRTDHITMFGKRGGIDVVGVFTLDVLWRDASDGIQPAGAKFPGRFQRSVDALEKLSLAAWHAEEAALAGLPVAWGRIEEHQLEVVLL